MLLERYLTKNMFASYRLNLQVLQRNLAIADILSTRTADLYILLADLLRSWLKTSVLSGYSALKLPQCQLKNLSEAQVGDLLMGLIIEGPVSYMTRGG